MASRNLVRAMAASLTLVTAACGSRPGPSPSPVPAGDPPIANVYILPGAVDLGPNAFGDEALVIFKGERMRWRNIDGVEHNIVPDTAALPEFDTTGLLAPGAERSFIMNSIGTTKVHCTIHPQMVGTLTVRGR
jgi:plastocyanin